MQSRRHFHYSSLYRELILNPECSNDNSNTCNFFVQKKNLSHHAQAFFIDFKETKWHFLVIFLSSWSTIYSSLMIHVLSNFLSPTAIESSLKPFGLLG